MSQVNKPLKQAFMYKKEQLGLARLAPKYHFYDLVKKLNLQNGNDSDFVCKAFFSLFSPNFLLFFIAFLAMYASF